MHQGHVHPDHFLEDVATVRNEMRSLEAELAEAKNEIEQCYRYIDRGDSPSDILAGAYDMLAHFTDDIDNGISGNILSKLDALIRLERDQDRDLQEARTETRRLREALGEIEYIARKMDEQGGDCQKFASSIRGVFIGSALAAPTPDGGVKCTCDSVKAVPGGGVPMCPTCERESEAEKESAGAGETPAIDFETQVDALKDAINDFIRFPSPDKSRIVRTISAVREHGMKLEQDSKRLEWLLESAHMRAHDLLTGDVLNTRAEIDAAMREGDAESEQEGDDFVCEQCNRIFPGDHTGRTYNHDADVEMCSPQCVQAWRDAR